MLAALPALLHLGVAGDRFSPGLQQTALSGGWRVNVKRGWAKKSLELAPKQQPGRVEELRRKLQCFEEGKPWRDESAVKT